MMMMRMPAEVDISQAVNCLKRFARGRNIAFATRYDILVPLEQGLPNKFERKQYPILSNVVFLEARAQQLKPAPFFLSG
jgi:hypothetical protein